MNKENVNIKEDNITKKKKTQEEIMKENSSLMDAFRDPSEDNIIEEEDVSKKMDPNILAALKAKMS